MVATTPLSPPTWQSWQTVTSLPGGWDAQQRDPQLATVRSSPPQGEAGGGGTRRWGELTGPSRGVGVGGIFQDQFWTLRVGGGGAGGGNVTRLVVVLSKCVV